MTTKLPFTILFVFSSVYGLGQAVSPSGCPKGQHSVDASSCTEAGTCIGAAACVPDDPKPVNTPRAKAVTESDSPEIAFTLNLRQTIWDALRTRVITDDEMDLVLAYGADIVPEKDGGNSNNYFPATTSNCDVYAQKQARLFKSEEVLLAALKLQFDMRLAEKNAAKAITVGTADVAVCYALQRKGFAIACGVPATEGVHGFVTPVPQSGVNIPFVTPMPKAAVKSVESCTKFPDGCPILTCVTTADGHCVPAPKGKP